MQQLVILRYAIGILKIIKIDPHEILISFLEKLIFFHYPLNTESRERGAKMFQNRKLHWLMQQDDNSIQFLG